MLAGNDTDTNEWSVLQNHHSIPQFSHLPPLHSYSHTLTLSSALNFSVYTPSSVQKCMLSFIVFACGRYTLINTNSPLFYFKKNIFLQLYMYMSQYSEKCMENEYGYIRLFDCQKL